MYTFLNDNIQIFYLGNGNRRRGKYSIQSILYYTINTFLNDKIQYFIYR